jgi:hypothetical protein
MNGIPPNPGFWQRLIVSVVYAVVSAVVLVWMIGNGRLQIVWLLGGLFLVIESVLFAAFWRHGLRWLFSRQALRFHVSGIVALLTVVVLFYNEESWRGKRAWIALQREIFARGESLRLESIAPPSVPDDQNFAKAPGVTELLGLRGGPNTDRGFYHGSADKWPSASWILQQFTDLAGWQKYFRNRAEKPDRAKGPTYHETYPATPEAQTPAADVLFALGKFEKDLAIMRAATQRPVMRLPLDYSRGYAVMEDLIRTLQSLWAADHLLALRASAELTQGGRVEAALQDVLLALSLAELLRGEPFYIAQHYRHGMLQVCLQPVWEGLASRRWNDPQLAALQAKLGQVDALADHRRSQRGDTLQMMNVIDEGLAFVTGQPSELNQGRPTDENDGGVWGWLAKALYPVGWLYQDKVWIYRFYQRHIDPLVAANLKNQPQAEREAEIRSITDPMFVLFMVPSLREVFGQGSRDALTTQIRVQQAAAACALERYRLAHGEYPVALQKLVPSYIPQVPSDILATTTSELKYHRTSDGGYQLYSVGFNHVDDGGKGNPSPETRQSLWNRAEDDPDLVWNMPALP